VYTVRAKIRPISTSEPKSHSLHLLINMDARKLQTTFLGYAIIVANAAVVYFCLHVIFRYFDEKVSKSE